jgi:hypothetical protein
MKKITENNWVNTYTEYKLRIAGYKYDINIEVLYTGIEIEGQDFCLAIKNADTDHYSFVLMDIKRGVIFDDIDVDDYIEAGCWQSFLSGDQDELAACMDWEKIIEETRTQLQVIEMAQRRDYTVDITKVI